MCMCISTNKNPYTTIRSKTPNRKRSQISKMAKLVTALITALLVLLAGATGEGQGGSIIVGSRPHGLPFETPIALSPSAYDFFHPGVVPPRARSAAPSPTPARAAAAGLRGSLDAGRARADAAVGGAWLAPPRSRGGGGDAGLGSRRFAGAAAGAVAAALAGAGVSYVLVRRRANIRRAKGDDAPAYVA